jgi:hypothetical protein
VYTIIHCHHLSRRPLQRPRMRPFYPLPLLLLYLPSKHLLELLELYQACAESAGPETVYTPGVRHRPSPRSFRRPSISICLSSSGSSPTVPGPPLEPNCSNSCYTSSASRVCVRRVLASSPLCLLYTFWLTRKLQVCLAVVLVSSSSAHVATASRALSVAAAPTEQRNQQICLSSTSSSYSR